MVMNETFMSNLSGWPTGADSDEYMTSDMQIGHGALTYSVEARQDVYSYRHPRTAALGDFYLEADVRQVSGPPNSVYGLAFRVNGWRHYFFGISEEGYSVVRKRGDRDGWLSSVQLAPTRRVSPGEGTSMSILAQGTHFVLCTNHDVVAEFDDADFREGRVGIGLSLSSEGDRATLEYTRFRAFEPAQPTPARGQISMGGLR
jgi:hypothetical protein